MENKKIETEIANITEPVSVTLADNPNYIEIEGINKPINGRLNLGDLWSVRIIGEGQNEKKIFFNYSAFSIKEKKTNKVHHFIGKPNTEFATYLRNIEAIDNTKYNDKAYAYFEITYFTTDPEQYPNLMATLSANSFFKEKYNLAFENEKNETIVFTAKGTGYEYDFEIFGHDPKAIIMSKTSANKPTQKISLKVRSTDVNNNTTEIKFVDAASMTTHTLKATIETSEINSQTFFVAKNKEYSVTAENIRACMMNNLFLKNNFHITIPTVTEDGKVKNGSTVWLTPKGKGLAYTFHSFEVNHPFIEKKEEFYESGVVDSLLEDKESCEIQIDVYKDVKASEQSNNQSGTYITTLSKAYSGKPIWFDINTIWANGHLYSDSFLNAGNGWCDTGTANSFRFTARRFDGVNNETFFYSDTLYAVTGYCRNLGINKLDEYVYNTEMNNEIKPLTQQPVLTHIEGQRQYFNFILSHPTSGVGNETNASENRIGIECKLYTQSGNYLGSKMMGVQDKSKFGATNTISIDVDAAIAKFPNTGIVKAYLWRNGKTLSEPLVYNILPACLYKVNDFAFLNSLGGWSSFNFGGSEQTEFKSDATTFYRTQTPDYNISSRIESVFNREVTEQFTVQTFPITADVAEWLKEISTSVAVYELSSKRYIIVDDLAVKLNSDDDLFRLQMKYHYSDSYNANIK